MGQNTKIEWAHHTFNPWRGCTKVSDGCKHCYADTLSKRNPGVLGIWGKNGTRVVASESAWREPERWNEWAAKGICWHCGGKSKRQTEGRCEVCDGTGIVAPYRARVFCASLADVFEGDDTMPADAVPTVRAALRRLIRMIEKLTSLDFLLVTKRPENVRRLIGQAIALNDRAGDDAIRAGERWLENHRNAWIGASVENQKAANERIGDLLKCPAAVRFLSMEPLLGPVEPASYLSLNGKVFHAGGYTDSLNWVIVGGESGPDARPMRPDWARSIRDQCQAAGVPFFFKQWGEHVPATNREGRLVAQNGRDYGLFEAHDSFGGEEYCIRVGKKAGGRMLDGRTWNEFPRSPLSPLPPEPDPIALQVFEGEGGLIPPPDFRQAA